jgi:hypothetical protein
MAENVPEGALPEGALKMEFSEGAYCMKTWRGGKWVPLTWEKPKPEGGTQKVSCPSSPQTTLLTPEALIHWAKNSGMTREQATEAVAWRHETYPQRFGGLNIDEEEP